MERARASCILWRCGVLLLACSISLPTLEGQNVDDLRRDLEEHAKRIQALQDRIGELEEEQETTSDDLTSQLLDLDDKVGKSGVVHVFDALDLQLGGFLTQTFTTVIGESDTESGFNQTLLEILLRAQITEDLSLFTALGFLREADIDLSAPRSPFFRDSANRVPQIIAWANYQYSDALELQVGRFITPHGIINIEHFPPVLLEINQPQFLRPFPGNTMFPNFLNGLRLHGKRFLADNTLTLRYDVYTGLFNGAPDSVVTGGRAALTLEDVGVTFGANYSHGRRDADPGNLGSLSIVGSGSLTSNDYDLLGADVLFDRGRLFWKNEVFATLEKGERNRLAFYTQPAWRWTEQWIGFYRFDYLDPGQGLGKSTEHVVGVNYLPIPLLRLRLAYIFKEFDAPEAADASIIQFSGTISF